MLHSVTYMPGKEAQTDTQTNPPSDTDAGSEPLQRRAALLELAESVANVGHWQIDLKKGRLFWSDEVYRIHGVTREEYSPDIDSAIDFYHPDDAARVSTMVDSAISDRRAFEFEFRLVRPDGAQRVVHSRALVQLNDRDEVVAVFGVLQDVTDERQTQHGLAEQVERFNLAALGAGVGLWDWDLSADEFSLSARGARLTGMPALCTGDDLMQSVVVQDRKALSDALAAHIERREPFDVECRVRLGNREIKWIHMCGQAQWDDDGVALRIAGSLQDVGQSKRHEALRQVMDGLANIEGSTSCDRVNYMLDLGRHFLGLDTAFIVSTDDRGTFVDHACDPLQKVCAGDRMATDPAAVAAAALRTEFLTDRNDLLRSLLPSDAAGPASAADMIALGLRTPGQRQVLLVFAAHASSGRVFGQTARSVVKLVANAIAFEMTCNG